MTYRDLLVAKPSALAGLGVFAAKRIAAGKRIVEYTGERISPKEADRRYNDADMEQHHTMLFMINSRTCIDGARRGNIATLINHSCDPNCEAVSEGSRLFIEALRDIEPGEELVYDYAYSVDDQLSMATLKKRYPCHCGARACRKTIAKPGSGSRKSRG